MDTSNSFMKKRILPIVIGVPIMFGGLIYAVTNLAYTQYKNSQSTNSPSIMSEYNSDIDSFGHATFADTNDISKFGKNSETGLVKRVKEGKQ